MSEGFGPPEGVPDGQSPAAAWRAIKVRAASTARPAQDASPWIREPLQRISISPQSPWQSVGSARSYAIRSSMAFVVVESATLAEA